MTAGLDKAYDVTEHVERLRAKNITPHVAQNNTNRRSAIDGRITRHTGYARSQTCRKMIECIFGWGKQRGTMRKTKLRGTEIYNSIDKSWHSRPPHPVAKTFFITQTHGSTFRLFPRLAAPLP